MSAPWFKFFARDWVLSQRVQLMTAEQRGIYLQLLCAQWCSDNGLPSDHISLMRLASCTPEEWQRSAMTVLEHFRLVDGRLWNPKLRELQAEAIAIGNERSHAGKKGNNKRWGNRNCDQFATAEPSQNRRDSDSDSRSKIADSDLSDTKSENPSSKQCAASSFIEKLWRLYPGNRHRKDQLQIPPADLDPIILAVARDGGELVTQGVEAFAKAVETWPANERSYIPRLDKFFSESQYRKDPAEWQRNSNPAEKPKVKIGYQSIEEVNRKRLREVLLEWKASGEKFSPLPHQRKMAEELAKELGVELAD